jgi:hypothetical protein
MSHFKINETLYCKNSVKTASIQRKQPYFRSNEPDKAVFVFARLMPANILKINGFNRRLNEYRRKPGRTPGKWRIFDVFCV